MTATIQSSVASRPSLAVRTSWCAIANLFTVAGRFAAGIIVARSLGPNGVGRIAYLFWIADTLSIVAGLGLSAAATRFMADLGGQLRFSEAGALCRWLYVRTVPLISLGAFLIALAGQHSKDMSGLGGLWPELVFLYVAQALGNCYFAYLSGLQRYRTVASVNAVCTAILVVGAAAAVHAWNVTGAVLAYAASSALPAILSLRLLRLESGLQIPETLRQRCLRYAVLTWFATLVSTIVWSRTEVYFLERFCDLRVVAMFAAGLTLASAALQGPALLSGALLPYFAERSGASDTLSLHRTYAMATRAMALLLFPACFGLAAITPVVLPAIYGRAFAPAVPTAFVLIVLASLGVASVGSNLIYALEKSSFMALAGLAGAALSVAGCTLAIPKWGLWGAVWARVIIQCGIVALGTWYIARRLSIAPPLAALGKVLLAAAVSACSAHVVILIRQDLTGAALAIPVAAAVYVAMLRVLRAVDPSDLQLLKGVCTRAPFAPSAQRALAWLVTAQ